MKTTVLITSMAAAVVTCAVAASALSNRVVGVLAGVDTAGMTLQLSSRGTATMQIKVDADTAYMKWVTHKPWQSGDRLDTHALVQGRCLEVELKSDGNVAKVVHINDDAAGSVFDPCRSHREPVYR